MRTSIARLAFISFVVCQTIAVAYGQQPGRLLNSFNTTEQKFRDVARGRYMLIPGAPIGGKHKANPVLLGVIDSGLASRHPQLSGFIIETADFTGEGAEDVLGHGTAVALIALYGSGVPQPPSGILSAKVVTKDGRIGKDAVIRAIEWMASRQAEVINLSLGFEGPEDQFSELCAAITKHSAILFVAAAGNSGPAVRVYPASCNAPNLISVAATEGSGRLAETSGKGDIAAPSNTPFVEEWRYYYEAGQKEARVGRLAEARTLYEKSLAVERNAESLFQLGVLELNLRHLDRAAQQFEAALQVFPGLAEAREHLGIVYFLKNDYVAAERELREALVLFPDVPRMNFNLGMALWKQGKLQDARMAFEKVKRLDPRYPAVDQVLQEIVQSAK